MGPKEADGLESAWSRRHGSRTELEDYAAALDAALLDAGTRCELDEADPSPDSDRWGYRETLRRDCCSVGTADGGRLTVFFLTAWFGRSGRSNRKAEQAVARALRWTTAGSGLPGAHSTVAVSATAGNHEWLGSLTGRDCHRMASALAASWIEGSARMAKALDTMTSGRAGWGPAVYVGVRVRHGGYPDGIDYFDRLDPDEYVQVLHGALQPSAALALRGWEEAVGKGMAKLPTPPSMVSWPRDRDGALAGAVAVAFDRQCAAERAASGFDVANAAFMIAPHGRSAALGMSSGGRDAGPVVLAAPALGWTTARAVRELTDRSGGQVVTGISDLMKSEGGRNRA